MGWKELEERAMNDKSISEEFDEDNDYDTGYDDDYNDDPSSPEIFYMSDRLFVVGGDGSDIPFDLTQEMYIKFFEKNGREFNKAAFVNLLMNIYKDKAVPKLTLCSFSFEMDPQHPCDYCPLNVFIDNYNNNTDNDVYIDDSCYDTLYAPNSVKLIEHLLEILGEKEKEYVCSEEII